MTREEALEKLKGIAASDSTEIAHIYADDVLLELLVSLGYEDVVAEWKKIDKWYG